MTYSIGDITQYTIRYSPGIIFSGIVPAFDINFINPQKSKGLKQYGYKKLATVCIPYTDGEERPVRK